MRAFRVVTTIFALVVLYLLLVLPGQVAEHIFISWIADGLREYTGLELPRLETILTYISFLMPLLAAGAAMYLYHKAYLPTVISRYQPVREGRRRVDWRSYFAALFLFALVAAVGYAGYIDQFRPAIPGATKYLELRHLPNPELRERAFAVAEKLRDLSKKYVARQSEINGQYKKDKEDFERQNAEYEKAKAEYDRAKLSCFGGFSITGTPPLISPSQSASPSSSSSPSVLPSITSLPSLTPCPASGPPSPPPRAPLYPVVSVDPAWAAEAEKVQQEAAAVWEEMHHRFGGYARFFDIPRNYNPENRDFSVSAKALEENANRLH
jgi:hypothetical protein